MHSASTNAITIKKKSVRLIPFTMWEVVATSNQVNVPMPHTRYICETSERIMRPYTIEYTKNECCPFVLDSLKIATFPT